MARVLPRARTVWRIKTWDNTKEEAFRHIHELVRMIIEEFTARANSRIAAGHAGCGSCLRLTISRDQFKTACESWPDADCAEVASVGGQDPVDLAAFRDSSHHTIDQS
jgi:hypothetical protein